MNINDYIVIKIYIPYLINNTPIDNQFPFCPFLHHFKKKTEAVSTVRNNRQHVHILKLTCGIKFFCYLSINFSFSFCFACEQFETRTTNTTSYQNELQ